MNQFDQTKVEREQIYQKVLGKIKPNDKDVKELNSYVSKIITKLNQNLTKIDAEAIIGGSVAKNTWLINNQEVDVFVQFDYVKYKAKSSTLSDILEEVLKQTFKEKIDRVHGSRDYFQIKLNKITFEFVPILKIKDASQAINITDVSPLHAGWVMKSG